MTQFVKSIEERRSHCAQCTIVPVKEEQHSHRSTHHSSDQHRVVNLGVFICFLLILIVSYFSFFQIFTYPNNFSVFRRPFINGHRLFITTKPLMPLLGNHRLALQNPCLHRCQRRIGEGQEAQVGSRDQPQGQAFFVPPSATQKSQNESPPAVWRKCQATVLHQCLLSTFAKHRQRWPFCFARHCKVGGRSQVRKKLLLHLTGFRHELDRQELGEDVVREFIS